MALPIHQINRPVTSPTITTPAAILDRAIVTRNSHAMLNACHELGVGFRAHVKSHKVRTYTKPI
jgi:D-serine deaminase-like pyridoxal phosphate-dependent protein